MQIKTDVSYGVIPLFQTERGEWEVLVIHQYGSKGDVYWGFPKGHAELGEEPVEAARRELLEETAISDIKIDSSRSFTQHYTFVYCGTRIKKTVQYFVGYAGNKALTLQTKELKDAKWCSFTTARERLTHDATRKMFDEVVSYLNEGNFSS